MMLAFQVILTVAEHHSCIVPWQIVSQKTGAVLKFVTLNEDEIPDIDMLRDMISPKTKLVAVHHVSNVLGRFLFHVFILINLFSLYIYVKENRTRLVSNFFYICSASSLPIEEIVVWAHSVGAKVLVDACQSVPHMVVDVQKLNADFLVASSHKVGTVYFSS